ncbi:hypothetical protein FNV43_RR12715 [Rhamnella rubrinervis]|uniref:Uncharacterized protein n=1 Tax=Rhamnella rubrinervis TaxID=2594499 RepID=A0A8K0MIJ4_9ROSA|nr:hypothetical protein FNV43_RR12715 [Rhamnella rubrinervis]
MEASSQCPPESNIFDDISGKLTNLPTEQDDAVELFPEIPVKEELIEEVMQELYKEIACSSNCTNPSSSSPSTTSFVAGNGKSESCGPSVSDLASTVMAGVEFVGSTERFAEVKTEIASGSSSSTLAVVEKGFGEGDQVDGCDGVEVDDEWLARVLSWGPVELDSWF